MNAILRGEENIARIQVVLVKELTAVITANATVRLMYAFVAMDGQELVVRYLIVLVIQIAFLEVNMQNVFYNCVK